MKNSIKQFTLAISLCLAFYASPAKSEVTGWITPDELKTFSRKMENDKLMPTKMECRGDSRSSSVRESMEVRVTYIPNPSNKRWRWAWGANFVAIKNFWGKHGWSLVSASLFTRPKTGLLVRCGVFHKDGS